MRPSRHSATLRLAGRQPQRCPVFALALVYGPRPADEALRTLDSVLPGESAARDAAHRARLLAMLGRFDEAWALALPAAERARGGSSPATPGRLAARRDRGARRRPRDCGRPPAPSSATCSSERGASGLPLDLRAAARPLAVRARPLRRGGAARAARPRARRRARLRHADAVAAGAGARPRPPRRARRGRAARPRGGRDRASGRTRSTTRATHSATSPRCSPPPAAPRRPPRRSSRRSNATSARRTWRWSRRCARSSKAFRRAVIHSGSPIRGGKRDCAVPSLRRS